MKNYISIIIPTFNEEFFILDCLRSVYSQDYLSNMMEVIVVDGNSSDRTVELIREFYPSVILLHNAKKIVPISMNIGIKKAKGNYIIRLDAHCIYPSNYFSRLVEIANSLKADNVGGACRTLPANESSKAYAIALALSTKFGIGNSLFRIGSTGIKEVDTVPFGCFPKKIFEKIGYYDEELIRNQDDELNGRILKNGGKIYLISDLIVDYYGRDSLKKVCKMFYQYGLFKPLGNKKMGGAVTLRQFAPVIFVVSLILGLIASLLWKPFVYAYLVGIIIYLTLNLIASIRESNSFSVFYYLFITYPIIHISYGWGYIKGFIKILFNRSFVVQTNR